MVKRNKTKKGINSSIGSRRLTRAQTRRQQNTNAEDPGEIMNAQTDETVVPVVANSRRPIPIMRTRSDPNLLNSTLNGRDYFEEHSMIMVERNTRESLSLVDKRIGALESLAEKYKSLDLKIGAIRQNVKDIEYLSSTLGRPRRARNKQTHVRNKGRSSSATNAYKHLRKTTIRT